MAGIKRRAPRPGALLAIGIFSLIASPALVYAARVTRYPPFPFVQLVLAGLFLLLGIALVISVFIQVSRGAKVPPAAGYLVMIAVVVSIGGFVLALAPDDTVFVSTLVGALVGILATKMEVLMKPRSRPSVKSHGSSKGQPAKQRRPQ